MSKELIVRLVDGFSEITERPWGVGIIIDLEKKRRDYEDMLEKLVELVSRGAKV